MQRYVLAMLLVGGAWLTGAYSTARAAPCLMVTLTGTQSGPAIHNGIAGAGTLVRYGDDSNECGALKLQFDAGRGTILRLSQVGVVPGQLNAMFFTHMHSDHTEGFAEIAQFRWNFNSAGPKLDVVCSEDAISTLGFTLSCRKLVMHIGDLFIQSGEIAQRISEDKQRLPGGPADILNIVTFQPTNEQQIVWTSGDVRVSAIRSTHIAGHASYRVDTPVGSVVIGGDASNDTPEPPRLTSTSDQVEKLAKRAGARYLMLTHLASSLGAQRHGPYKVPGGPLTEADYRKVVEASGFTGITIVGTDLATIRLPAKQAQ